MIDYSLVLIKKFNGKQWVFTGDSYEGLQWNDESPKPTKSELNDLWNVIIDEAKSEAYKDLRAKEYPSIADQLDYIYHNGIDAWKTDMIDPVKTKYPKGTV